MLFRSLNGKQKQLLKETIQKVDASYGTDLAKQAGLIDVWSTFGKPSFDAVSSGNGTSTSRTVSAGILGGSMGSALGSLLGFGAPGAALGGGIGAFLASKAVSPATIKQILKLQQAGGAKAEVINQLLKQIAEKNTATKLVRSGAEAIKAQPLTTTWNLMRNRE